MSKVDKKRILEQLNKIEAITFQNAIAMESPTLEMDLSVLVFEATYYKYSKIELHKEKTLQLLSRLVDVFPQQEYSNGFLEGFEGVFWVVDYLEKCEIIDNSNLLDELLPHLIQSLRFDLQYNNFDVFHGSINKLHFIITSNKFPDILVIELVNEFLDRLYENRIENEIGIYWYDVLAGEKGLIENVYVNLGIPHGMPGLLLFLIKLKEKKFQHDKIDVLVEGILKVIFNSKNINYQDSYFPGTIAPVDIGKEFHESSRLAYCYGDLGVVFAVLYASKILDKPELKEEVGMVIESLKTRLVTNSSIDVFEDYLFLDTAFCHGLSGVVYMFSKINKLLNNEEFEKRTEYWIKELLHNLEIQLTVTTSIYYPDYKQPTEEREKYTIYEQSILGGYSGTGLVLLSLLYEKFDWSDFFMLY